MGPMHKVLLPASPFTQMAEAHVCSRCCVTQADLAAAVRNSLHSRTWIYAFCVCFSCIQQDLSKDAASVIPSRCSNLVLIALFDIATGSSSRCIRYIWSLLQFESALIPQLMNTPYAGTHARLRSKQQLLNTLVERVRDQNAYTRARVLQTWMQLAERKALPLGHWVSVTQLAAGTTYSNNWVCCSGSE